MADTQFEGIEGGYAPVGAGGRFQHFVNMAGAVCSVALIAGIAVWGYKLAMRDVAGVPVIRAIEGPLRVAPDNPGGEIALHQGLSVNAVAEVGAAQPLPEELILAPRPVELALEDAPGLATEAMADGSGAVLMEDHGSDLAAPVALAAEAPPDAIELALAEALGAEAFAAATEDVAAREALAMVRPQPRPVALAGVTGIEATSAVATAEIDPSTLQAGTRLVQLGAFDEAEAARAEWQRLQAMFGDLMAGKSLVVQPATAGGRTFYRLRAHGFEGEDDARRFCSAVLDETSACIPVTQR